MAVMPGRGVKQDFIPLEPFVHQVGGHCSMMKFDDVSVCKPLNQREHRFYEEQPSEMRPFTPEFRGVVHVSVREDEDGYIHFTAHPDKLALECYNKEGSKSYCTSCSESDGSSGEEVGSSPQRHSRRISKVETVEKLPHRVRLRSGKLELVSSRVDGLFEAGDMPEHSTGSACGNPWGLRCHKEELNKMRLLGSPAKTHKFIVLENVAYKFSSPCILDLKMGTQQHGDDAPREKRDRQMAKAEKSTTKTLGIRACGMQVYQRSSGRFMCRNKYYGMKLCEDGFREELVTFLNNGHQFRAELIEPFLQKLRKLHKVIEKQNSFRFYTSSLLLMYEGDVENNCDDMPGTCCSSEKDQETCKRKLDNNRAFSAPNVNKMSNNSNHHRSCKVDVRMIDFAHTTYGGFSGDRLYTGPDTGYLFGLQNLIRILGEIQDEYQQSSDPARRENIK
ncbi:inositol hexakisphosphate kinase 1-like [Montipora foliosa]|uniref:inositol hexakisphosphate kinase 1-like n=1 Tax=Montipora foliosa TaxID=591990 RepID=UPI0035F1A401